jgi:mono/diheme cytochrome c family protein
MKKRSVSGILVAVLLTGAQALAAPPLAVYTAAQATAGAAVFATNCSMCHGAALQGVQAPALVGQSFAPATMQYTVGSIFTLITGQMPLGNPGSLSHSDYAAVMAFILSKNGYPAGETALDYTAALSSTVPLVSQVK